MIFPLRVFGRPAANRTSSGRASEPISLATCWRSSSLSAGLAEKLFLRVTKQTRAWPLSSSGRPTTAASATAGCETSALSTSAVPIRCPETLRTSSIRPTTQR